MQTAKLERNLGRRLGSLSDRLLHIAVVSVGDPTREVDDRLKIFGCKVAPFLASLLLEDDVDNVGVGWGRTVELAIDGFDYLDAPPLSPERKRWFVPTCCHARHEKDRALSSTRLAADLDRQFNGRQDFHLSLDEVPHLIPFDTPVSDVQAIRRAAERDGVWTKIFGNDPLVKKLDILLTSVASPIQANRKFIPEFAQLMGVSMEELARRVIADIGGAWIPREAGDLIVDSWNERWTGIRLSHYSQIAARAMAESKPGVVVIAIDENKKEVILEVVKRDLVNTLIIDDSLASALVDQLGGSVPAMQTTPTAAVTQHSGAEIGQTNARRIELLKKELLRRSGEPGLTVEEKAELERAEKAVADFVDETAPIDFFRIEQIERRLKEIEDREVDSRTKLPSAGVEKK